MVQQISGTVAFFKAMAADAHRQRAHHHFVYCFAKISQLEQKGGEEGRLTYLWLLILVFFLCFMGSTPGEFILESKQTPL